MKNIVLILASGSGKRSGLSLPKQFFEIDNKTLLEIVVSTFENHEAIDEIIVVVNDDFVELTKKILSKFHKVKDVVVGGETRQKSSFNGIMSIKEEECNVLIHDSARVFVTKDIISSCIASLKEHEAICTTISSTDTIFKVDGHGMITDIPERSELRAAQTPQCFRLSLIKKAHLFALENNIQVTDDCGLIQKSGLGEIYALDGNSDNRKITYIEDFELAKLIYKKRLDLKKGSW